MLYNEETYRNSTASLRGQSPRPRCKECEGHGHVLSTRNLRSFDSEHLEWQPCEACNGTGLGPVDTRGSFPPRDRSYSEE
jgi:DnaJ-class molecular chaperone